MKARGVFPVALLGAAFLVSLAVPTLALTEASLRKSSGAASGGSSASGSASADSSGSEPSNSTLPNECNSIGPCNGRANCVQCKHGDLIAKEIADCYQSMVNGADSESNAVCMADDAAAPALGNEVSCQPVKKRQIKCGERNTRCVCQTQGYPFHQCRCQKWKTESQDCDDSGPKPSSGQPTGGLLMMPVGFSQPPSQPQSQPSGNPPSQPQPQSQSQQGAMGMGMLMPFPMGSVGGVGGAGGATQGQQPHGGSGSGSGSPKGVGNPVVESLGERPTKAYHSSMNAGNPDRDGPSQSKAKQPSVGAIDESRHHRHHLRRKEGKSLHPEI